jgi:hypothetical protein
MKTKKCSRCKEIKDVGEFNKRKDSKDGYSYWCKLCFSIQHKLTYNDRKDKIKEYCKEWYYKNYDKLKEQRVLKKDKTKERHKIYYENNKEIIKVKAKNYVENNKDLIKEQRHKHYLKYKDKIDNKNKEWAKNNPEKVKINQKKFDIKYRKTLKGRLNKTIHNQMNLALKKGKNGWSWEVLVGYTLEQLMHHLENLFTENMNWDNYGKWHIDHIIPKSLFKYETYNDREFKQCWSLCNLQPLWAKDNLVKGNKLYENRRK